MIPLLIDLSGRCVLICGGGEVAARKAAFFLPEAEVTVVSRSFASTLLRSGARLVEADLDRLDDAGLRALCSDADLVVAATSDPALNGRIVRAARSEGVLANSASGAGGNVQLPAVARGRRYVVAVGTGGESPGMARFLREAIEEAYPRLDEMVALQARLRSRLRDEVPDQGQRSSLLRAVLEDRAVWAALDEGEERAWQLVEERYLHA
jgi:precorrin-2 dehydrogenase / sirohydrochlorin ferrochelatase